MNFISRVLIVLVACTMLVSNCGFAGQHVFSPSTNPAVQQLNDEQFHNYLRGIYSEAWKKACEYTEMEKGEMPHFPYNSVHWLLTKDVSPLPDQDFSLGVWETDFFTQGHMRVFAWYKSERPHMDRKTGMMMPTSAHIEILLTQDEMLQHRDFAVGVLVHEMIHYIHHIRCMNEKGFYEIWPDGHSWMKWMKSKGMHVAIG